MVSKCWPTNRAAPCSPSLCRPYDPVAHSISNLYAARSTSIAARRAREMMDHLDKLDYAFLGCSVAGFLLCIIAMWRQKPIGRSKHNYFS
jgi:hypothetical protein